MNSLSQIRAVTFDAGGTLIRPWPTVGHIYAGIAARHGFGGMSPEALNRRFATAWQRLDDFHYGREEWAALVDRVFDGLTATPPSETFFPALYEEFCEPGSWHIFEDVIPALEALAGQGISLGIVSNWDERLPPLLERLGLRRYFQTLVVSRHVGFTKPSPVIFELAARSLGLPPEFILHIGDSPRTDVAGARAAGFAALLLNRGAADESDDTINSLRGLEVMLESL